MPTNARGIANISETTSLLTKDALQKSSGFLPDSASVVVRPGYHLHCIMSDKDKPITPLCISGVSMSGEKFIMVVGQDGFVYVSPVNRLGKFYVLARRYLKTHENLYLFNRDGYYVGNSAFPNNQNTAKVAKIISVAKSIYILSNENNWVIHTDGMIFFDDVKQMCVVDALNATIHDIENETPKLQSVGRVCSTLQRGDEVYVRARSELGGYGAPSNSIEVPETNGYIVYGIKGMTNISSVLRENITT